MGTRYGGLGQAKLPISGSIHQKAQARIFPAVVGNVEQFDRGRARGLGAERAIGGLVQPLLVVDDRHWPGATGRPQSSSLCRHSGAAKQCHTGLAIPPLAGKAR